MVAKLLQLLALLDPKKALDTDKSAMFATRGTVEGAEMTILRRSAALAVTLGLLIAAAAGAARAAGSGADEEITTELKALEDPTIIKRRTWLETEWNNYKNNSNNVDETLGGLWGWGVSDYADWAVRLKIPYRWHDAGDDAGDENKRGFIDLKAATGVAFRFGKAVRAAAGAELRMPTAQNDLGEDYWRLQEFATVAWDVAPWLSLSPSAEHNHSFAERNGADPSHYLELYFPATFLLPQKWSVTPRGEIKVNYENRNYVSYSAKLSVSKRLQDLPLGFTLSLKRPFDGGTKEFQVNWVMSYYFVK